MSSIDEESDIAHTHGMETFNWRGDNVTGAEVEVRGGASVEEVDLGDLVEGSNGMGIVKTTRFTIEEQDVDSVYEKRWMNF